MTNTYTSHTVSDLLARKADAEIDLRRHLANLIRFTQMATHSLNHDLQMLAGFDYVRDASRIETATALRQAFAQLATREANTESF